jgi:hypothetical protein
MDPQGLQCANSAALDVRLKMMLVPLVVCTEPRLLRAKRRKPHLWRKYMRPRMEGLRFMMMPLQQEVKVLALILLCSKQQDLLGID